MCRKPCEKLGKPWKSWVKGQDARAVEGTSYMLFCECATLMAISGYSSAYEGARLRHQRPIPNMTDNYHYASYNTERTDRNRQTPRHGGAADCRHADNP